MPRPKKIRFVSQIFDNIIYKPQGIPLGALEIVELTNDEFEAIKLADLQGLYHEEAAKIMKISRQTFGRILNEARKKIADALVNNKAIKISGGTIQPYEKIMRCKNCNEIIYVNSNKVLNNCPKCNNENLQEINQIEYKRFFRRHRRRFRGGKF